jgi:hypothetical protein
MPTRIRCSVTCAAVGFASWAARTYAELMDGPLRSTAKPSTCPSRWPPAHAISACSTALMRRARSNATAASAKGQGCLLRCVGPSGCRDGDPWPRTPTSPASCTPRATPSTTHPRSQRSRTANCGGAAGGAGTSGRRQPEPAPVARAVLNAIASVSADPEPWLASVRFRLFTPALLPSGTRPATAISTRRISARARSRRSGGAALRAGTNGGQLCRTERPVQAIALCVGSSAVPGLRARSSHRGHSRSSIRTSPPSCTRSATPGSSRPGWARAPASSSGGNARAAGMNGRPPSRRAPPAAVAARCVGSSAVPELRARSSRRGHWRSDIPTSPPSCTRSATPGSSRPGWARDRASSSGGNARAAGMNGRQPSRRAPMAVAARPATGPSAAVHERRCGKPAFARRRPDEGPRSGSTAVCRTKTRQRPDQQSIIRLSAGQSESGSQDERPQRE